MMNRRNVQKLACLLLILSVMVGLAACDQRISEQSGGSDGGTESVMDLTNHDTGNDNSTNPVASSDSKTSMENHEGTEPGNTDSTTDRTNQSSSHSATDTETDRSSKDSVSTSTSTAPSGTGSTPTTPSSNPSSAAPDSGNSDTFDSFTEPEDLPVPGQTDISPIAPKNYFGRVWLATQTNGTNLVQTYDEIVSGTKELRESISLTARITGNELSTVWSCFTADYPQFFWVESKYTYYHVGGKVTELLPSYSVTKSSLPTAQAQFDRAVNEILSGINGSMTQYQIEKTIHDRLILRCQYQETANAHNAYGALVKGVAVCEGISKAFQHLCRSVGIDTLFVFGKSDNPSSGSVENHAWNIVKIDGKYYHVDSTWDNAGEPSEGRVHYEWFNLTTDRIKKDHVLIQTGYAYPKCTATQANYFIKTNGEFSSLSVDAVVARTVKQGNEFFFRGHLLNESDPYGWMDKNASTLAKRYGLNGYQYRITTVGNEICIVMSAYNG